MKSAVEYNAFIHRESRVEPHHSGFLLFFYFNGTAAAAMRHDGGDVADS